MKIKWRYQEITRKMKEKGRFTQCKHNFDETKDYRNSAIKIKDNFKSDLKERGIIFGVAIDKAYLPEAYRD
jgi:hypothetical protein